MNQQQEMLYGNYAIGNSNRSPNSSRPGYNTSTGYQQSNRQNQRQQLDSVGQPSPSLYGDDRFNSYDGGFRHNRLQPNQGFPDGFMLGNNQAWNYNAGAATVNGAMGDGGRLRAGNRRGPLPSVRPPRFRPPLPLHLVYPADFTSSQEWTGLPDQGLGGQPLMHPTPPYQAPPLMNQQLGMMNGGMGNDRHGYQNTYGNMPLRGMEEKNSSTDLIPTAIVIKNIPFNIRKETLTGLMTEMCLPQPYAFNYHFDQGVFRGLAFANFQNADDTAIVIEKMNGLDVQGRKLRVEYKKMLPEHERERIEREKREKRGQLEEQHRSLPLHQQASMHSLTNASTGNGGQRNSPLRKSPNRPPSTNSALTVVAGDVDLNNPETLNFYTELTLFRNDPNREILVFPSSITPTQRRSIHILAHNMGLEHRSAGEGQHRQLHVIKDVARTSPTTQAPPHLPPGVSLDAHRRGLSRAATIDFAESRMNNASGYHTIGRQGNPMLELPGSPDTSGINGLRGVKSFADLRSYTPSPSPSVSGYSQANGADAGHVARFGDYTTGLSQTSSLTAPTTPGGSLAAPSSLDTTQVLLGIGSMSLGGYDAGNNQMRPPRDTPGAIGSQRPGVSGGGGSGSGGSGSGARVAAPERQPRGPGEWDSTGFGGRRPNGHTQRGSGTSHLVSPL